MSKSVKKDQAVWVAITNSGYWGKGYSLIEAMKNANYNHSCRLIICIVITDKYEKVFVDDFGTVHYPNDAIFLTDNSEIMAEPFAFLKNFRKGVVLDYLLDEYLKDDKKARSRIEGILLDANISNETELDF